MIKLRRMETQDLSTVLEWRNHVSIRKNMYTQSIISEAEHKKWWQDISQSADCCYLMYEADGVPLGVVSFNEINLLHMRSSWAFYASPDAPKGTGSKMELLAINYAFETLSLKKLYCEVISYNVAVISLHKKFGFVQEGRFVSHFQVGEQSWDVVRLALFKEEWQNIRHRFERVCQ